MGENKGFVKGFGKILSMRLAVCVVVGAALATSGLTAPCVALVTLALALFACAPQGRRRCPALHADVPCCIFQSDLSVLSG